MSKGAQKPDGRGTKSMVDKAFASQQEREADIDRFMADGFVMFYFDQAAPSGRWTLEDERKRRLGYGRLACKTVADVAMRNLGTALRDARKKAGLTQREAAEAAGMKLRTLQRTESGERDDKLTMTEVLTLSILYGARLERVLGMMSAEEEHLLELYKCSTKSVRPKIIETVEMVQSGAHPSVRKLIDKDEEDLTRAFEQFREEHELSNSWPEDGTDFAEWVGEGDHPSIEVNF